MAARYVGVGEIILSGIAGRGGGGELEQRDGEVKEDEGQTDIYR